METEEQRIKSLITRFPGKSIYYDTDLRIYGGNHLPHWETKAVIYHVSFRLADSIPDYLIKQWINERNNILEIARNSSRIITESEVRRLQFLYSNTVEKYLDAGHGSCLLRQETAAAIVKSAFEFYNGEKYLLHAWSIMPNHVHVIFEILNEIPQNVILKAWKSFTAHAINKALNRKGQLWQVDSYNHIIRTEAEYYYQMRYVWNNPQFLPPETRKWRWSCLINAQNNVSPKQL